jgi:opacity protein-like surface antigen
MPAHKTIDGDMSARRCLWGEMNMNPAAVATKESKLNMSHLRAYFYLIGLIILPLASGRAQEFVDKGFYAVARAGAAVNPEAKFDTDALNASLAFDDKVKYKMAPFGEVGGGYSFGKFRVEETLGYSSSDAKSNDTQGRARFYFLTISGFADIPVTDVIVPYVGGGMGAVRVDSDLSWASAVSGTDVAIQGNAWGPFWHVDTGVGFHVAPKITVELGVRYAKSFSSMKGIGHNDSDGLVPVAQFDAASGTLGVRSLF